MNKKYFLLNRKEHDLDWRIDQYNELLNLFANTLLYSNKKDPDYSRKYLGHNNPIQFKFYKVWKRKI